MGRPTIRYTRAADPVELKKINEHYRRGVTPTIILYKSLVETGYLKNMAASSKHSKHFPLTDIPSGQRRTRIFISIILTVVAFVAFVGMIVSFNSLTDRPSDTRMIAAFATTAISMGLAHGTHAMLRNRDDDPKLFANEPGLPDAFFLIASFVLIPVGCYFGLA